MSTTPESKVECLLSRPHRLLPHILSQIGEAHRQGLPTILLVPEQFTLQAELELTRQLDLPGFFDIQVLSPTRLSQRVFEITGAPQRVRIDSRGKAMVMRLLLEEHAEELDYYRGAARAAGFVDRLCALVADLKSSDISPEALLASAQALPSGRLRQKLLDTVLLYQHYEAHLSGRFVDGEDLDIALDARLPESGLFDGNAVWVYGFDMLSQSFSRRLTSIAKTADKLSVCLTAGDRLASPDALLFEPALTSLKRFEDALDRDGITHRRQWIEAPLQSSAPLRHIESQLFAVPSSIYLEKPEGLDLHAAATPFAQVHHVAALIRKEMRIHGRRLGEMTVQYPPSGEWPRLIRQIFPLYDIAAHVQEQRSASGHPMIQTLLTVLRCLSSGFRQEDMCAFLKSGFTPLTDEEAFALENYALAQNLQGNAWLRPLKRGPAEELETLEPLRARLAEPLLTLRAALRADRSTQSALTAIYDFLVALDVPGKLEQEQPRLQDLALFAEVSHSTQVWNALMEVLSQMQALLPQRMPRLLLVAQMLESGLAATALSALPAQADMLLCGELGNLRTGRVEMLFCLGLNDPGSAGASPSLLDDNERFLLQEQLRAFIGIQDSHRLMLRRVDLLSTLSLPTQGLYVGYTQSDASGQALRPDVVIRLMERLFPALHEQGGVLEEGLTDMLSAPRPALDAMAIRMRDALEGKALPPDWNAAWLCLREMPETAGGTRLIQDTLGARFLPRRLPGDLARRALGEDPLSASRLETFAACAFQHFVSYMLRPQPRRVYGIYRQDLGLFYHETLMAYARAARLNPSWPRLSKRENDALVEAASADLVEAWADGPLGDNPRAQATGREVLRVAKAGAWAFCRQAEATAFRPALLEWGFGLDPQGAPPLRLPLPEGGETALRGRVDRIDMWRDAASKPYLAVLDYKATQVTPKLSAPHLSAGLQLQLPLYLDAALQSMPEASPAGLYYFQLHNPLINSLSTDPEVIEEELDKAFVLQGLTVQDPALEDASRSAGSSVSPETMTKILSYTRRKAGALVQEMRQGVIDALPTGDAQRLPCTYCSYRTICALDPMLPGAQARVLPHARLKDAVQNGLDTLVPEPGDLRV